MASTCAARSPVESVTGNRITGFNQPNTMGTSTTVDSSSATVCQIPIRSASRRAAEISWSPATTTPVVRSIRTCRHVISNLSEQTITPANQPLTSHGRNGVTDARNCLIDTNAVDGTLDCVFSDCVRVVGSATTVSIGKLDETAIDSPCTKAFAPMLGTAETSPAGVSGTTVPTFNSALAFASRWGEFVISGQITMAANAIDAAKYRD